MDLSENSGTPKSSILTGFSIINHPFWGTPIFGNTRMVSHPALCPKESTFSDMLVVQRSNVTDDSEGDSRFDAKMDPARI